MVAPRSPHKVGRNIIPGISPRMEPRGAPHLAFEMWDTRTLTWSLGKPESCQLRAGSLTLFLPKVIGRCPYVT
jgi:hypothetical protein